MLLASPLWAEDRCFSEEQVKEIIVGLEKGKICEVQVPLYDQALAEKDQQIEIATELGNKKFGECEAQRAAESAMCEAKDKARVQEIKDTGKTKWGQMFGAFGVGAVLAIVAAILL